MNNKSEIKMFSGTLKYSSWIIFLSVLAGKMNSQIFSSLL